MTSSPTRCLVLACGNSLRGDDGVGPWLAAWAEDRFRSNPTVRILMCHQWTPELAEDVAHAESVFFIDCSVQSAPGTLTISPVEPSAKSVIPATHHLGPAQLLALARELYHSQPHRAHLLTIGAGSLELGETFSASVQAALPEATSVLETTILQALV